MVESDTGRRVAVHGPDRHPVQPHAWLYGAPSARARGAPERAAGGPGHSLLPHCRHRQSARRHHPRRAPEPARPASDAALRRGRGGAGGPTMPGVTLLSALVEASGRIRQTRSRIAKVRELAALLRELAPDEIAIATRYLSGETPQGRIGIGYAVLRAAAAQPAAPHGTLAVADVDAALTQVTG